MNCMSQISLPVYSTVFNDLHYSQHGATPHPKCHHLGLSKINGIIKLKLISKGTIEIQVNVCIRFIYNRLSY